MKKWSSSFIIITIFGLTLTLTHSFVLETAFLFYFSSTLKMALFNRVTESVCILHLH